MNLFKGKTIVVTGGTGSIGKVIVKRLLNAEDDLPKKVIVFSRDEAKQHFMRMEYENRKNADFDLLYNNFKHILEFRIGDLRDYHSVCSVLKDADIVINTAALKQVPSCEYFPFEAMLTNVVGPENIIRAIRENDLKIETVVGVSTDKACKPVCAMGMTKSLMERVFIGANILNPGTRFICVRNGNVLASRGSAIPLFHEQIKKGGPVTITDERMTRFLLPLEKAVDVIFAAIESANPGETYVPKVPSTLMTDITKALIGDRKIETVVTGIRPGEKLHETMISEEEAWRSVDRGDYYAIKPMLPEIVRMPEEKSLLKGDYSSEGMSLLDAKGAKELLRENNLLLEQQTDSDEEFLR